MHIAVIGAGTAGRQFAVDCAVAGLTVTLEDVMPSRLRSAETIFSSLGTRVRLVSTVEDAVDQADLVIDFVPDELESKLEILSLLDRMAPPRTILLTPSDVLSITDLASCTYRPDRCIMMRGLALPPTRSVKLLTGRLTSEHTITVATSLCADLGIAYTVLPDPDLPMLMKNMGDTGLSGIR